MSRYKIFSVPEEGLELIRNEFIKNLRPTILLIDINMPTLTGWEFMEQFEKFSDAVKKYIIIYILSSSVDKRERRAEAN